MAGEAVSRIAPFLGGWRRRPAGPVRIAVIVPVWRQAEFLAGAVRSALAQRVDSGLGVVIVNDGCPDPETHRIGTELCDADPHRVSYLRQPNRGVSAARNVALEEAFDRWPEVDLVFPLDADNRLSRRAIAQLASVLDARPDAAWASPSLEFYGDEEGEWWQIPGPYSPYRQLYNNQTDTGSLVRRSLFEAGFRYDEQVRNGFEDWDFFLRATVAGHRGVPAGRCGFRYRRRAISTIEAAEERAKRIAAELRARHPDLYGLAAISRREHEEMPRFALVSCDGGNVRLTSRCDLEPRRLPLAEFVASLASAGGPEPTLTDYLPAITVLAGSSAIDRLEADPEAMAAALTSVQEEMRGRGVVELRTARADAPCALAVRGTALGRLAGGSPPDPEATVEVGANLGAALTATWNRSTADRIGAAVAGSGFPLRADSHSVYFERHHIDVSERPLGLLPGGVEIHPFAAD